jgi:hypothetical protein
LVSSRPLVFLALLAAFVPARATDYAGDFEELGTSARAIGMGGAVVATLAGPAAIYYNPARSGRNEGTGLLFLHSEDFSGLVQHNYLGATFSARLQSFGVALLHNGIPGIKLTALPDSTLPPGENNRPYVERVVSANQLVGYVNYSRILSPLVALGANAKLIYQDIGVGSCFGMGLDLGIALTPVTDLDVGLRLRNISTSPLFWTSGTRESILPRAALGVDKTFRFGRDAIKLALEVSAIPEQLEFAHSLGVEYSFRDALFARLGMHEGNLTFGLGGRYRRFYVDYGYTSGYAAGSRELGSAQQFSGGVEF